MFAHRRLFLTALPLSLLAACAERRSGGGTPAFYRDLSRSGTPLDQGVAAAMISQYRQNNGLQAVTIDPRLSSVASELATAMARADNVQISLRQPPLRERLAQRGFNATVAQENVSAGYRTMAEAFSGWRGSPPHDRVMRLPGATRLGIAAVPNGASRFGVYWALVMAAGG